MKYLFVVLALSFGLSAFACTEDGSTGFVPENDIYIPVGAKTDGGLTEAEFNTVIDELETLYVPVASNMGGKLTINRLWDNGTANANATRMGSKWTVNMYGGLARHKSITKDGFSLVLCHEIGHQLGGAPKVSGLLGMLNRWASNEGQADYFATLKCLRKIFIHDNNAAVVKTLKVPARLAESCAQAYGDVNDKNICIRSGMAGVSVAGFFAAVRNSPEADFNTPDVAVVKKTFDSHPAHQCRLDTYFQGALCDKGMNEDVSQKEEVQGTCHATTGFKVGLRPLCWFKPAVI